MLMLKGLDTNLSCDCIVNRYAVIWIADGNALKNLNCSLLKKYAFIGWVS